MLGVERSWKPLSTQASRSRWAKVRLRWLEVHGKRVVDGCGEIELSACQEVGGRDLFDIVETFESGGAFEASFDIAEPCIGT